MIKTKINGEIGLVDIKLEGRPTDILAETVMLTTGIIKHISHVKGATGIDQIQEDFITALRISIEAEKIEDADSPEKALEYLIKTKEKFEKGKGER